MGMRGEQARFWLLVGLMFLYCAFCTQGLIRTHLEVSDTPTKKYDTVVTLNGRRGSIFSSDGGKCPLAKSVPVWEYRLDPVAMADHQISYRGEKPRKPEAIARTIADTLHLDYRRVLALAANKANRFQYLTQSDDVSAFEVMTDRRRVAGVAIAEKQPRQYPGGHRLSHVIGSVNANNVGSAGIELMYDKDLSGAPGKICSKKDARGRELYEKRTEVVPPVPGRDIYLTVDNNLQYEAETALAWGLKEYGAGSGWCTILDAKTGAVLAMASLPDFHPLSYGRCADNAKINRVTNYTYEPGSVMKVITACAGLDTGFIRPDSLYSTDRYEEGYYKLPGDGSHVWEPRMTIRDAIVHSSNIVIGKLGYNLGQKTLLKYFKDFGFGAKTGVGLPGEETGMLPPYISRDVKEWDKATRSRAPIGQAITVTALQMASAYQAIANDGIRMKPYIVETILNPDGTEHYRHTPEVLGRPISRGTSRQVREMMLGVASSSGTARRAAIRGYSIAGKTGTAQKSAGKRGYLPGLYRATFCGIVPSGVVKRDPADDQPVPPRIVVLVTLDFDEKTRFHQGGNSAGPVFKRIATAALRYLAVEPDKPYELMDLLGEDEFDRIMDERAAAVEEEDVEW